MFLYQNFFFKLKHLELRDTKTNILVKKLKCIFVVIIDNEIGLIDLNDKSVLSDVQQRITYNFECSKQIIRAIWMLPYF